LLNDASCAGEEANMEVTTKKTVHKPWGFMGLKILLEKEDSNKKSLRA
jgi:hypothetical protein